jgi:predicted nucleic acid-binding protein
MTIRYLADTSAVLRLTFNRKVREAWEDQLERAVVGVCAPTELEVFHNARSAGHRSSFEYQLKNSFIWVSTPLRIFTVAAEIQGELTKRGTHRAAGAVDLMVAATAMQAKATVLHYDRDFLTIADVTGQEVRWVAEPGTVN